MMGPVVFDLYGTLLRIDALRDRLAQYVPDPAYFVDAWRAKQIAYAWTCSLMETYYSFDDLTAAALDYVAAAQNVALDDDARGALLDGWLELEAYPDVAPALEALRERDVRRIVFTNGVAPSAHRALERAGIAHLIDRVLTVEPARLYKPSPRVYQLVCDAFELDPPAIRFVSSNAWDASGAATFGFSVIWCNRSGAPRETIGPVPPHTIRSLDELPAIVAP